MIHFYPEVASNPKLFMATVFQLQVFGGNYLFISSGVTATGSVIGQRGWNLDDLRSCLMFVCKAGFSPPMTYLGLLPNAFPESAGIR